MATRKPGVGPQVRTIDEAHERLGLSYADIAAAVGVEADTLERWRHGDPVPVAAVDRLAEFRTFIAELDRTFADPEDGRMWLGRSNPALGGRAPSSLIASGEVERVTRMLYALNAGIPT